MIAKIWAAIKAWYDTQMSLSHTIRRSMRVHGLSRRQAVWLAKLVETAYAAGEGKDPRVTKQHYLGLVATVLREIK